MTNNLWFCGENKLFYYHDKSTSLYKCDIRFLVSSRIIFYLGHTRTYQNGPLKV